MEKIHTSILWHLQLYLITGPSAGINYRSHMYGGMRRKVRLELTE